jgi:hypothetical protein
LSEPYGVAVDSYGDLLIADTLNQRIRKVAANAIITTMAGDGTDSYSGDGGPATSAALEEPYGAALDASGNLYIADTGNDRVRKVVFQGPTLVLTNVSAANTGSYDVEVIGYSNTVTTSHATITVVFPAAITTQPQSQTAMLGSNATFNVTASGTAPLSYQWYFGAAQIPAQTAAALVLNNVNTNIAGNYQVVITNLYGAVTSSVAVLSVLLPPQNLSARLSPGQGVELQGTGAPGYAYVVLETTNLTPPILWQPVATNIVGANGTWTFIDSNALTRPAGFYRAMLP